MATAASLSLLKGGKAAVEEELTKETENPAAEAAGADDEEVVVDVDTMSSEELDSLVTDNEIETPAEWSGWDADAKRAWLKEQFEETTEDAPTAEPAKEEPKAEEPKEEPKAAKKKPAAKKTTSKAVATKDKAKEGQVEVPGEDVLSDLVHEIENMNEKSARSAVTALSNETEMTSFKLGGVLSVIQANGWYEPYASFREYVEKELGMHYRKATYWVSIYNHLVEAKVPWEKVKGLGWTKLKEIAEVLTLENVDEWVKIAQSQTTLQLIETVKAHKSAGAPKAVEDQAAKTVTTMTFKVHEDQKETVKSAIEKAKGDSGTTVDTAALEFICLDYLGGQSMSQKLQKLGLEAALEALEKAFPNTNITVELPEDVA